MGKKRPYRWDLYPVAAVCCLVYCYAFSCPVQKLGTNAGTILGCADCND